jgi:hypothetical protein
MCTAWRWQQCEPMPPQHTQLQLAVTQRPGPAPLQMVSGAITAGVPCGRLIDLPPAPVGDAGLAVAACHLTLVVCHCSMHVLKYLAVATVATSSDKLVALVAAGYITCFSACCAWSVLAGTCPVASDAAG